MGFDLEHALAYGWHPIWFAENILGILLNPAQKRWFSELIPAERWRWTIYECDVVSGNQTGKTLGLAILILWANHNKIGVDPVDRKAWLDSPYNWYHLAPDQNTAYLPLKDIALILKGTHPAQFDKGTNKFRPCLLPEQFVTFKKIETYYDGIEFWNGAVVQCRTTDDRAKALQGRRAWGISYDECAFEDHLKDVVNETLMMRLISTGGPLILVSTPNGINDWFEIVEAVKDSGHHPSIDENQVWVTEPDGGRKNVLVWATTYDNAGYGLSIDEINRREDTLDEQAKEQALRGAFLEPNEAFFVPSDQILKAFIDIPSDVPPEPGHRYVIFWDVSVASDPTAAYIIDVSTHPWRVVHETYSRRPQGIQKLIPSMFGLHGQFSKDEGSSAITGFDETGMGGAIIRQQLYGLTPLRPLNFAGTPKVKIDVLTNLRTALLRGDLLIPAAMTGLKREIVNYRLEDKKIVQDRVIALAGATWIASKGFTGVQSAVFSPAARITSSAFR